MEFRKVLALRGPNVWANSPVLEVWVDLGPWKDSPSNTLPGFNDRLMGWLPTMIEHHCGIGERGGFFQRLRTGTYLGHILEHVTLELQSLAGVEVGYGRARETSEEGVYRVVFKYKDESLARACVATSRELILAAIEDRPFDVKGEIERLRDMAHDVMLGPSTNAIVEAARSRGIPTRRLNNMSLVQLGYGAKQRRIQAAETSRTGAIAEEIAQDKDLTRTLLRAVGVPVADGRPVENAEDAWEAAEDIGVPVVVKPRDGNKGRGVATNLSTRQQVIAAYDAALLESRDVIVERFAPGHDYRVLVVGGRVVAAARREPAQVCGDGAHTIRQLIAIVNEDPRRADGHATVLSKIKLDAVSLGVVAEQGYTPDSVPPAGSVVLIRRNGNLSTGGTAIDVTERVHPQVAARAVEAAAVVGLDIAGIDVIAMDISRPLEEQRGIIVEVNAAPGLRMHLEPSVGVSRPVGEAIIATLFPDGEDGRIPIAAVTGVNGKTTTTRFINHILKGQGLRVGMTCTDGIYLDGRRIDCGDCSGPQSARSVLMNPNIDAAVFETARGGIIREGLGFDRCDVAVVTNIGSGDHLGLGDINTTEALAKVKRCIVDVVPPNGRAVLNANDPLVVAMEPHCAGAICYFALDGNHPVIVRHRAAGGQALFVRNQTIVLAEGENEEPLLALERVPLTRDGMVDFHVENTLAAIGAALGLKVPKEVICARAETFAADMEKVPARFNVLEIKGATVVVDYGHNVDALAALIKVLEKYPHQRRTCVYSTAGDRRDCDMVAQGKLLGDSFDRVILYEDHYLRGRPQGQIIALFRQGVEQGGRAKAIEELHGADAAVEAALRTAQPGDLMLVQADTVDETMQFIRNYVASLTPDTIADDIEATAAAAPATIESPQKAVPTKNGDHGLLTPSPTVAKV
jgi:cyanophycin synthetase